MQDDERGAVLYELFFADCESSLHVYKTALAGMLQAYQEVKKLANDVCDGVVRGEAEAVNVIYRLSFMRQTLLQTRSELTQEPYEDPIDIPVGIINQFNKDIEEKSRAMNYVRGFDGTSGFAAYEKYAGLLAEV